VALKRAAARSGGRFGNSSPRAAAPHLAMPGGFEHANTGLLCLPREEAEEEEEQEDENEEMDEREAWDAQLINAPRASSYPCGK